MNDNQSNIAQCFEVCLWADGPQGQHESLRKFLTLLTKIRHHLSPTFPLEQARNESWYVNVAKRSRSLRPLRGPLLRPPPLLPEKNNDWNSCTVLTMQILQMKARFCNESAPHASDSEDYCATPASLAWTKYDGCSGQLSDTINVVDVALKPNSIVLLCTAQLDVGVVAEGEEKVESKEDMSHFYHLRRPNILHLGSYTDVLPEPWPNRTRLPVVYSRHYDITFFGIEKVCTSNPGSS